MKISMSTVPKDKRTWSLYSITRGPCATSARHMTSGLSSGGTTSSIPKCLFRPGATAAGAWPRHALGSVLLLDLIFIASCLRHCALSVCITSIRTHRTTWPPHLHMASRTCTWPPHHTSGGHVQEAMCRSPCESKNDPTYPPELSNAPQKTRVPPKNGFFNNNSCGAKI